MTKKTCKWCGMKSKSTGDYCPECGLARKAMTNLTLDRDYLLQYCKVCLQMTNHLKGVCQKHNKETPSMKDNTDQLREQLRDVKIYNLLSKAGNQHMTLDEPTIEQIEAIIQSTLKQERERYINALIEDITDVP